jgi:hypothetical protein
MNFNHITSGINQVIDHWEPKLLQLPETVITQRLNAQNRSIKQLLGHLVDSASNNHQRMVRLQYNKTLEFPDYTQDNDLWIAIQNYQNADWHNLVQLWKYYNLQIIQIINSVDELQLQNNWCDYEGNCVTLAQMIDGYLWHLELHIGEIKNLINDND